MKNFLQESLIEKLRKPIQTSPIFYSDEKYKNKPFKLYCAVLDRLRTSVGYLNKNSRVPENEEKTLSLFMHACIVLDGIEQLAKAFELLFIEFDNKNKEEDSYKYFQDTCLGKPLFIEEENCPNDYCFFQYLRSLIFAHPFNTNRASFLKKSEFQFSPFIMAKHQIGGLCSASSKNTIGIVVYSTVSDELYLCIPFQSIKDYIKSRYNLITKIIDKINQIIQEQEEEWLKRKVKRNCNPVETLADMYNILEMRYRAEYTEILTLIEYLEIKFTLGKNDTVMELYSSEVINAIPSLCKKIESGDIESFLQEINKLASPEYPSGLDLHYAWASILNRDSRGIFTSCAKEFYEKFAKKWVEIDFDIMTKEEIVLLCIVACYLDNQEQHKGK